jgi:cytochrome c peroxidase
MNRHKNPLLVLVFLLFVANEGHAQLIGQWPTPATPPGNRLSKERVLLGKMLFWDEQLSADRTVSCGTCHFPEAGGNDANGGARHPGADGILGTADDIFGSPGVVRQSQTGDYVHDPVFGVNRLVTGFNAPTPIGAAFFEAVFWDNRATSPFTFENGTTVPGFAVNAALESQAVGPPVSPVEMGHDGIVWSEIEQKLGALKPLALATQIPPSIPSSFLSRRYSSIFLRVFGPTLVGSPITNRERIAMAMAAYMRTLTPDRSPIDGGVQNLTPAQQNGFNLFVNGGNCAFCHSVNGLSTDPSGNFTNSNDNLLSDGGLHNIGLPNHPLAVKTPTLRNVGLRKRLFHSGQSASLKETMSTQYNNPATAPFFRFNPLLTPAQERDVVDFLANALTDPRVAGARFPFDRPRLRSESVPFGRNQFGSGSPGTGGFVPVIISNAPEKIGNSDWKVGVGHGLGGSIVVPVGSRAAQPGQVINGVPVEIDLSQATFFPTVQLSGTTPGEGTATLKISIPDDPSLLGTPFFVQFFVVDFQAAGGIAASPAARFRFF